MSWDRFHQLSRAFRQPHPRTCRVHTRCLDRIGLVLEHSHRLQTLPEDEDDLRSVCEQAENVAHLRALEDYVLVHGWLHCCSLWWACFVGGRHRCFRWGDARLDVEQPRQDTALGEQESALYAAY